MTKTQWQACLAICLLLSVLQFASPAHAYGWFEPVQGVAPENRAAPVSLAAEVGFEGYCRLGTWNLIRVELSNTGPDLNGKVQVEQVGNARAAIYTQEVSLPNTSRKVLSLYIYLENSVRSLQVQFITGTKTLANTSLPLTCMQNEEYLAGVMSEHASPFNLLSTVTPARTAYIAEIRPEYFPENLAGLEILNILIVSGIDTGGLSSAQRAALSAWIGQGGQLLVFGGPDGQKTAAGLSDLLPVELSGTKTLPAPPEFTRFFPSLGNMTGEMIFTRTTLKPGAQVLAGSSDTPLVIVQSHGSGRVVYLPFDPGLEPFSKWPGQEDFYRAILSSAPGRSLWSWGPQSTSALYNAVTYLPGQGMPSPLLIIGFMLGYAVCVGPANFFVMRRLKRRELSWFTIPAIVVLFCLLAFGLGAFGLGTRPIVNEVYVVQSSPHSDVARVDGMVGIYSPVRSAYAFKIDPPFLLHPFTRSNESPPPKSPQLTQGPQGGQDISQVRIDQAGISAISVYGQAPALQIDAQLVLQLINGGEATLTGQLTNNSSVKLKNAVLLIPRPLNGAFGWLPLGDLPPGKQVKIDQNPTRPLQYQYWGSIRYNDQGVYLAETAGDNYNNYNGYVSQSSGDSWLTALAGSQAMGPTPEEAKQYMMALSLTNSNFISQDASPGAIYLAGWSDTSPAYTQLSGPFAQRITQTLYLIHLDCTPRFDPSKTYQLEPSMFTWRFLEKSSNAINSPFGVPLNRGGFSLSYMPIYPVQAQSVKSLSFFLSGQDPVVPSQAKFSLWDFTQAEWLEQPVMWGNNLIEDPQRYVSPLGEIRLRIENTSNNLNQAFQINQADFTLTVQP
jgi:hypothetical protein